MYRPLLGSIEDNDVPELMEYSDDEDESDAEEKEGEEEEGEEEEGEEEEDDSGDDNDSDADDDAQPSVADGMYPNLFMFLFES